jgi:hypothetical protein
MEGALTFQPAVDQNDPQFDRNTDREVKYLNPGAQNGSRELTQIPAIV